MSRLLCFVLLFVGQLVYAQDDNPAVLLIPDTVEGSEVLADVTGSDVLTVQYQTRNTSLSNLLKKIKNKLAGREADSIGFAVHDYGEAKFYLTAEHTVSTGSLKHNLQQQKFWRSLGDLVIEDGRIDIFACNLAKTELGYKLIRDLQNLSGVTVTASENETGNSSTGGDWIMESANLDIAPIYFNPQQLEKYSGLLWALNKKIVPADGAAYDTFGRRVSISGDTMVITGGAAAYIYARNQGGTNNWGLQKKVVVSGTASGVAIDGDTLVIGDRSDDNFHGAASIFYRNQGGTNNWGLVKKIVASDRYDLDYFGGDVAIYSSYVVVGAWGDDDNGDRSGSVYLFERDSGGANNWGEIKKIVAPDGAAQDQFGEAVSIYGGNIIVGAPNENSYRGAAYIFGKNQGGVDQWGQMAKLVPSGVAQFDYFGKSVSIYDETAVVGAPTTTTSKGKAYLIRFISSWGITKEIVSDETLPNSARFGYSVHIHDDLMVIGAIKDNDVKGGIHIFQKNQGGTNNWGFIKRFFAADGATYDELGSSVAISSDFVIAGCSADDDWGNYSGSAYLFEENAYDVTVNSATGGITNKDGVNAVPGGTSFTVTATPEADYNFTSWSGDSTSSANPVTLSNITSDKSITPVFTRKVGTLNVNINAGSSGGSFTITGPADFNSGNPLAGQTSNFSQAVPTGHYTISFAQVGGYLASLSSTSFTINTGDATGTLSEGATETVSATYIRQYSVYVNSSIGGSTDKDGNNLVLTGGSITITATPDAGYSFLGWSGDASGTANPLTINNVSSDLSITPAFDQMTGTLVVNINAGTSSGSYSISGPREFNNGNPLSGQTGQFNQLVPSGTYNITFTSQAGYGLSLNTTSFNVSGNMASGFLGGNSTETISGTYTLGQYTVTVPTVAGGSTDKDGANTVNHGDSITITATADEDYKFNGWVGDIVSTDNPLIINNITRDYTVTPVYEALPGKGHLQVTLLGTSKGKWRLKSEKAWRASGATVMNLPTGEQIIECKAVEGFRTPESRPVVISHKQTSYVVIEYIALLAKPRVHYFTATPNAVEPGGIVSLEWHLEGADSFQINNSVNEQKDLKSSDLVQVDSNSEFILEASNQDGSSKARVSVKVEPESEIIYFTSSCPESRPLYPGKTAQLSWFVKGTSDLAILNKTTGEISFLSSEQGNFTVTPEVTTEYVLRSSNAVSNSEASCRITVSDALNINSFTANSEQIYKGNKAMLSWDVQGTDQVEISPEVGPKGATGNAGVVINQTTTFSIKAGDKEQNLTIEAVAQAPDLRIGFLKLENRQGKTVKKPAKGQLISLQAKVENRGTADASAILVQLQNGTRTIAEEHIDSLAAGATETIELPWIARESGKHKLLLTVDPFDKISEIDENNTARKNVRVKDSGGVDLLIDDLKTVVSPDGKTAEVSWSVINIGNETSDSFQYQVYLAKGVKKKLSKALALVADDHVDSLAPGEILSFKKVVELSKASKKLYAIGSVDVHGAITEINELNNKLTRRIK